MLFCILHQDYLQTYFDSAGFHHQCENCSSRAQLCLVGKNSFNIQGLITYPSLLLFCLSVCLAFSVSVITVPDQLDEELPSRGAKMVPRFL